MTGPPRTDRLLARDRLIVAGALAIAVVVSASYILRGGGTGMSALDMTRQTGPAGAMLGGSLDMFSATVWSPGYAAVVFLMWWLMMIAMMVPSAAPTILLYGALHRKRGAWGALEFALGYVVSWAGFSLVATAIQAVLAANGLVSAMYMNLATPWFGAVVLIGAGLYQFSPIKGACLDQCRGPVEALTRHRRVGMAAAFRIGLSHGSYCLGCCWALMALLFVGGVMNIWWILGITIYIAVEKLATGGARLARPLGLGLVIAGALLLAASAGII